MATVYRAVDRETAEWCAIKVLHAKYIDRPKVRMRFASEAIAMGRLRHRNVIHIIDVNTDGAQPFFAMELAEGGCVVEWLAQHGAMPPKMAVDVAIQVCKGLGAAHRQGVIHRDVKPHNVLVNRRGVCKITDFGIAQIDDEDLASLTRTGSVMGTLGYIAPEQRANAKDVDETTDVYSVGATLYTMVTGRTTMDLFFADQEPAMMEGVHPSLQPIVMKATRYRREDRHQSMRDLAKELYHVKTELPEDPTDTPSLVMRNIAADSDELVRLTTSDTTFERSNTGDLIPTDPTLPSDLGETSNTPVSSSGISRSALLRGGPGGSPVKAQRSGLNAWAMLLAMSPLLVLLVIVGGMGLSGQSDIAFQDEGVASARAAVVQALSEESDVVVELTELGADRKAIETVWKHSKSSEVPHLLSLVTGLRELAGTHQAPEGSSRIGTARQVQSRIDRIESSVEIMRRAEVARLEAYQGPTGRVALLLGLVDEP